MPCWTRQEVKVALKVADPQMLRDGLKAQGLNVSEVRNGQFSFSGAMTGEYVSGRFQNGQLRFDSVNDTETVTNGFKRAYSTEIVKKAGARFKWNVKAGNKAGKFQVQRRF